METEQSQEVCVRQEVLHPRKVYRTEYNRKLGQTGTGKTASLSWTVLLPCERGSFVEEETL